MQRKDASNLAGHYDVQDDAVLQFEAFDVEQTRVWLLEKLQNTAFPCFLPD